MIKKTVFVLLYSLVAYHPSIAQESSPENRLTITSATIFEIGIATQIGSLRQLDNALSRYGLDRNASSTYLTVGLGYGIQYRNWQLSTLGRYGINLFGLRQYTLDWNIIRLSLACTLNDRMQLSPVLGYGLLHMPVHMEVAGNNQSSLNGLSTQPNTITVQNAWAYLNFGVSLSTLRVNQTNISLSLAYTLGLGKSPWRNGATKITDLPDARMNAISLSIAFSGW